MFINLIFLLLYWICSILTYPMLCFYSILLLQSINNITKDILKQEPSKSAYLITNSTWSLKTFSSELPKIQFQFSWPCIFMVLWLLNWWCGGDITDCSSHCFPTVKEQAIPMVTYIKPLFLDQQTWREEILAVKINLALRSPLFHSSLMNGNGIPVPWTFQMQ